MFVNVIVFLFIYLFLLLIFFFPPTLHFAKHESSQFGPDLNSLLQTTVWHNNNMSEVRAVMLGRTRPSGYKNQKKVNSTSTIAHPRLHRHSASKHVYSKSTRFFYIVFPFYFPIKTLFDFCFSLFRLQITFLSLPFSSFLNSQITAQTHHTLSLSLSLAVDLFLSFSLFESVDFVAASRSCSDSNPVRAFHLRLSIGDSIAATDLRSLRRSQPPWRPPTLRSPWKRP